MVRKRKVRWVKLSGGPLDGRVLAVGGKCRYIEIPVHSNGLGAYYYEIGKDAVVVHKPRYLTT